MDQLRMELKGDAAQLGTVPAADVARAILALERAVAWTASVVTGRPSKRSGRRARAVEEAADLRLVAVVEGNSVDILLTLPEVAASPDDGALDLSDLQHLSSIAADRIVDAMLGEGPDPHPYTLEALNQLGDDLDVGGQRYPALHITQARDGRDRRSATFDLKQRTRLREATSRRPSSGPDETDVDLLGRLVAADFESGTGRLRGSDEAAVEVHFSPEMAQDVKDALLEQTRLAGQRTTPRLVEVQSIRRGALPPLEAGDFWSPPDAAALAAAPAFDPDDFYDDALDEDERDALVDAANSW